MIEIPNAMWIADGILSGGQPTEQQLSEAAKAGFRTIINLRDPDEPGSIENEREQVEALGMSYVAIPISADETYNEENVRRMMAHIEAGNLPAMVHCASGNRVGVLFALKAFWVDGADADAARAIGTSAGMRRAPGRVEAILSGAAQE